MKWDVGSMLVEIDGDSLIVQILEIYFLKDTLGILQLH